MARGYRPVDRDQVFLLPPNLRDWLPPGHRVWFVLDIVEQLDLAQFHALSKRGGVGRAGYDPRVLLAVLIYAYMQGELSSRGIERACTSDVAYMVACGRDVPDHTVIARFRQQHRAALKDLFTQVLVICVQAGMGKFGVIAIDGTKIAANASMHRNRKLSKLKERAAELAEKMLASAADTDAAEDARYGTAGTGMDLHPLWADQDTRPGLIKDTLTDLGDTQGPPPPADAAAAPTKAEMVPTGPDTGTDLVRASSSALARAGVVASEVSTRAQRGARDKDTRMLAALASVQALHDARDASVRQPQVRRAKDRLAAARLRVNRIRAEQLAKQSSYATLVAAGGRRGGPPIKVEDNATLNRAKTAVVKAEKNLLRTTTADLYPSAMRTDPQGNLTDPDSRKMPSSTHGGFLQAYNAQLAVSDDHLILVAAISQSTNDLNSGVPMINATTTIIDAIAAATHLPTVKIGTLLLDAGYCTVETITAPGPNRLIATGKARDLQTEADKASTSTMFGKELTEIGKMAERLVEPDNAAAYKRRGATVEPTNAHIKHRRGLHQFSCRGLAAVDSELHLAAMVNNLTKLHAHQHPPTPA